MGNMSDLIVDGDINYFDYVEDNTSTVNKDFADYRDGYLEWKQTRDDINGEVLPWNKTHDKIAFAKGQLTVWTGYNGHMKTQATLIAAMWFVKQDTKVMIASMEMMPYETIERISRMASGVYNPSDKYDEKLFDYFAGKLFIFDRNDQISFDEVVGMINHSATVRKCNHIFIDSLMMCGVGGSDLDGQQKFIDKVRSLAKQHQIHIHLIAHSKKPTDSDESKIPSKYDISGSANISNMAHNVISVWMNKRKQRFKETGFLPNMGEEEIKKINQSADIKLDIQKQRSISFEGVINLWIHGGSGQLIPMDANQPMLFSI